MPSLLVVQQQSPSARPIFLPLLPQRWIAAGSQLPCESVCGVLVAADVGAARAPAAPMACMRADISMAWDENTATCSRVPASVRIELLVAATGSAADPQRRVVLARSRVVYRKWRHPWAGIRGDNATDATFSFPLETVVRFAPQEQAQRDAVRRLPPLRMSLPEDFFYPFTSGETR